MPNANINRPSRPGGLGAEQTDAERAASQVKSALDSVTLINEIVISGSRSEQDLATISRNVEHLKIVVDRPVVKNSTEDLAPLNAAIASGTTYITGA